MCQACHICGKFLCPDDSQLCQSAKTDITSSSRKSSETESGIPIRIMLLQPPSCAPKHYGQTYTSHNVSPIPHSSKFPLSLWRFLITISFIFEISSFKEFMLLTILFSITFIFQSSFILLTSFCFSPQV